MKMNGISRQDNSWYCDLSRRDGLWRGSASAINRSATNYMGYSYYEMTCTKGYVAVEQEEVQAVDTFDGLYAKIAKITSGDVRR
jgi:hypothetical protein